MGLKNSWGTPLVTEASYEALSTNVVESANGAHLTWAPIAVADDFADNPELLELDTEAADEGVLHEGQPTAPSAEEVCLDDLFEEQGEPDSAKPPVPLECTLTWAVPVCRLPIRSSIAFLVLITMHPCRTT